MKITYFGHSCFGIEINGTNILFDPFISQNKLASHIDIKSIKADYILVSHGHFDHVLDVMEIANNTGATIVGCVELTHWFSKQGAKKVHGMNCGGSWMFPFGKIKAVAAVHSSCLPDGTYGGMPLGFLVETDSINLYYAGDTALTYDMKLIGDFKKIDVAFLPIGGNYTMNIDNAVIAATFVRSPKIVGMHYNTFSSIEVDIKEAESKFAQAGFEFTAMEIGSTLKIG